MAAGIQEGQILAGNNVPAFSPDDSSLSSQRRRHTRFATAIRVEYEVDGRRWSSFTSEISAGGLSLRGAKGFKTGQSILFAITLPGAEKATQVEAVVRRVGMNGAQAGFGFEFISGQEPACRQILDFFANQYVPKLEELVARSPRNIDKVVQLSSFYLETGRADDGLRLLRRAATLAPDNIDLIELLAWGLVDKARALGTASWPILKELDLLFDRARDLPERPSFVAAKQSACAIARQIERRQQDEEQSARELRENQHAHELETLRDKVTSEVTASVTALVTASVTQRVAAAKDGEAENKIRLIEARQARDLAAAQDRHQAALAEKQKELHRVNENLRHALEDVAKWRQRHEKGEEKAQRREKEVEEARAYSRQALHSEKQSRVNDVAERDEQISALRAQLAAEKEQLAAALSALEHERLKRQSEIAEMKKEHERLTSQRNEIERELNRLNEARKRTLTIEHALANEFWISEEDEPSLVSGSK